MKKEVRQRAERQRQAPLLLAEREGRGTSPAKGLDATRTEFSIQSNFHVCWCAPVLLLSFFIHRFFAALSNAYCCNNSFQLNLFVFISRKKGSGNRPACSPAKLIELNIPAR